MSPVPPPDPAPTTLDTVAHYAPIGAGAALVRALLNENPESGWFIARRTVAASITAWMVGPAIEAVVPNHSSAMLAIGAVSYAAPQVWDIVGKRAVSLAKALLK